MEILTQSMISRRQVIDNNYARLVSKRDKLISDFHEGNGNLNKVNLQIEIEILNSQIKHIENLK